MNCGDDEGYYWWNITKQICLCCSNFQLLTSSGAFLWQEEGSSWEISWHTTLLMKGENIRCISGGIPTSHAVKSPRSSSCIIVVEWLIKKQHTGIWNGFDLDSIGTMKVHCGILARINLTFIWKLMKINYTGRMIMFKIMLPKLVRFCL